MQRRVVTRLSQWEGNYVMRRIFAHGAEKNATVAGDGTRAVSTWGGSGHGGGIVWEAVAGGGCVEV